MIIFVAHKEAATNAVRAEIRKPIPDPTAAAFFEPDWNHKFWNYKKKLCFQNE